MQYLGSVPLREISTYFCVYRNKKVVLYEYSFRCLANGGEWPFYSISKVYQPIKHYLSYHELSDEKYVNKKYQVTIICFIGTHQRGPSKILRAEAMCKSLQLNSIVVRSSNVKNNKPKTWNENGLGKSTICVWFISVFLGSSKAYLVLQRPLAS